MIGLFAFLNARTEGSRAAFNGWSLILLSIATLIISKKFGVDWKAAFHGLGSSYSMLAMAMLAAVGLGALAGLLARWSLRWNLTPPRVGFIFFAVSLILINVWTLYAGPKEAS